MDSFIFKYRRILVVFVHLALIVLANYAAFLLRFDGAIPVNYFNVWAQALPWLVLTRMITFLPLRLYEGLWRYAGIWDLRNIIVGVAASSCVFLPFSLWRLDAPGYPRSILAIDSLLLILTMGGVRLGRRLYYELSRIEKNRRILVIGAGDAGERIVRDMRGNPNYDYELVGFIDDDLRKVGTRIHGLQVLGTREALSSIVQAHRPHEVLVAIPSASAAVIGEIVRALEPFKTGIKTLPRPREIDRSRGLITQIRGLKIEDLLSRAPVGLDSRSLEHLIRGKRVLVTGAGGSIGSELCYQLLELQPKALALYDRYENGLFAVMARLGSRNGHAAAHAVVGDITDSKRLDAVMREHRPEIVFHAAAHKHVPLMESNVCEAVKNNVIGTHTLMEAAARHNVECFVLISTDKAVNPTSVMGTTKRIAEMLVQAMVHRGRTAYLAVRFGNVLASNGSVVPTFLEQIKDGGPVTVTHPDIRRYFMLIPEAVQLVLHAAALAEAGAVYVLEMGNQVKLVDMARNLIRLSGFIPDDEIPIVFTGLRPGEKLFEELVASDERAEPAGVDKVLRVRSTTPPNLFRLNSQIADLERLAIDGDVAGTLSQLARIVPAFGPDLAPDKLVAHSK